MTQSDAGSISNSLWDFSLAHYGKPRVADACLQLQNSHGVNINLLLWSLWLENRCQALSETRLAAALEAVVAWECNYVQPLRELRRRIKQDFAADLTQVASLREQIKRAELQAEKQELLCLECLALDWPETEKPLGRGENLAVYLRSLNLAPGIVAQALIDCGAVTPLQF